MCRKNPAPALIALLVATAAFAGLAGPALGGQVEGCFERARGSFFDQIDDFAVASCDPPCPGKICCSNGTCVNSVLACGDSFGTLPPSFKVISSERSHLAGAPTQGVLAAVENGGKANVWAGYISGDDWRRHGVAPGYYQLVLEAAASDGSRKVAVIDRGGRTAAQLPASVTLKDPGGSSGLDCDWGTDGGCLFILCCHNGRCVQLSLCILTFG